MVRIVLADDHAMIRQAVARALADVAGFQVVGQASTAEEAIELVDRLTPNVVLMDVGMPGMGGLAATEAIRKAHPEVRVLIVTIHDREDYFFHALRAGASGYILKDAALDELVEAVNSIIQGDIYIFPSLMPKLVTNYLRQAQRSGAGAEELKQLSSREEEVLRLIAGGRTTNEIAQTLTLSPHTVRRHRDHIMEKLNLHSKADIIRFAIRQGLLDEPK